LIFRPRWDPSAGPKQQKSCPTGRGADFERWYVRCKRAFTAMEKARQWLARLQWQLANLDPPGGLDLRAEAEAAGIRLEDHNR
jgi:hypothetical protein